MTWHDTNPTREHELPPLIIGHREGGEAIEINRDRENIKTSIWFYLNSNCWAGFQLLMGIFFFYLKYLIFTESPDLLRVFYPFVKWYASIDT